MSIEVVKTQTGNSSFSLWVRDEQGFQLSRLLELLTPLDIGRSTRVYESFGPAELIDDISTADGVFTIHQEFDEFVGTTIYSENVALMEKILTLMLDSGLYHLRLVPAIYK